MNKMRWLGSDQINTEFIVDIVWLEAKGLLHDRDCWRVELVNRHRFHIEASREDISDWLDTVAAL